MNPLLEDVLNEPKALRETLRLYRSSFPAVLAKLGAERRPGGFAQVVLTGMGSSYFAAVAAANYLQTRDFAVTVVETGELLHYGVGTLAPGSLVVLTSQSGETVEALRLLDLLQAREGVTVLAVTNTPQSSLAKRAALCLHLQTAKDHSVAIKTYVSSIMALTLVAGALLGEDFEATATYLERGLASLALQASRLGEAAPAVAAFLGDAPYVELIGRGPSMASALGGALLLREASKVFGAAITGGQVRHGAVEVIAPGYVAVLFAPTGRSNALQRQLAREIVGYGGRVVLLAPSGAGWDGEPTDALLEVAVEAPDEYLATLIEIVPLQMVSYLLAVRRGVDPGQFVNTAPVILAE
ncbi:MAG: SIS domain-containing protein [Chitinophagales bacterium]